MNCTKSSLAFAVMMSLGLGQAYAQAASSMPSTTATGVTTTTTTATTPSTTSNTRSGTGTTTGAGARSTSQMNNTRTSTTGTTGATGTTGTTRTLGGTGTNTTTTGTSGSLNTPSSSNTNLSGTTTTSPTSATTTSTGSSTTSGTSTGTGSTSMNMTTGLPRGSVAVSEDVLIQLAQDAPHHLLQARTELMDKDFKSAANEIRKSAALVRLEMLRSTPEAKNQLMSSETDLLQLADQVEGGRNVDMQAVQETFASTELALARHHNLKAQQYSSLNENENVGREVRAAVQSLQDGLLWSGQRLATTDRTAFNTSNTLATSLIDGMTVSRDRLNQDLQTTNTLINKYHDQALNALNMSDVENE